LNNTAATTATSVAGEAASAAAALDYIPIRSSSQI